MQSEADRLRTDLQRYKDLRAAIADERTRKVLSELIAEIEDGLRRLADRDDLHHRPS
jgi:hypothetical protein